MFLDPKQTRQTSEVPFQRVRAKKKTSAEQPCCSSSLRSLERTVRGIPEPKPQDLLLLSGESAGEVPESGKAEGSEFEQQSRGLREVPESVVPSEQQSHASRASGVRSSLCMLRYL